VWHKVFKQWVHASRPEEPWNDGYFIPCSREDLMIVGQLSQGEFEDLLLMMGYAMAAAVEAYDYDLATRFMNVANAVNRDNPNFIPYRWDPVNKKPVRMTES
jgi:hypothetical protein